MFHVVRPTLVFSREGSASLPAHLGRLDGRALAAGFEAVAAHDHGVVRAGVPLHRRPQVHALGGRQLHRVHAWGEQRRGAMHRN